jgi:hypothetical protein
MTDLEHADISRRLALSIGWSPDEVRVYHTGHGEAQRVEVRYTPRYASKGYKVWRTFDYRDPAVIWSIAERFNCFPWRVYSAKLWHANVDASGPVEKSDTAALAVALAVIKAKGQP